MFLPTDHSKHVDPELPHHCTFRDSDWHILAGLWHPVAFAHEIGEKPVAAKLLDVELVIYRTKSGITIARDQCRHRGTKLSGGSLFNNRLVCPMHGLQYDGEGYCRFIPSMGEPTSNIPEELKLRTYRTMERYGIVWTCLKDAATRNPPEWKRLEDPLLKLIYIPRVGWSASAARHVENFNDVAHLPWLHKGSFGDSKGRPVPRYEVQHTEYGLKFEYPYVERGNRFLDGRSDLDNREIIYRYELTLPFSSWLELDLQDSDFTQYCVDTVCPVSAHESVVFQILTDNSGAPDQEYWIKDTLVIDHEDRHGVELQFPKDLPLDLRQEIHIPADRMSLEYRKALASFGLGAPLKVE